MADKSILQPEPTEAAQAALAAASELQSELVQAKKRIEGFVNQNEKELSVAVSEHEAVMVALEGIRCFTLPVLLTVAISWRRKNREAQKPRRSGSIRSQ
mgnify:CR=1 FL=1